MKDNYKSYVNDVNYSFKNKKSRVEMEKEKQQNFQVEFGFADQIYNSRAYQDHQ